MINVAYFSNQFADREGHGLARYSRELFDAFNKNIDDVRLLPVAAWSSMDSERLEQLKKETSLQIYPLRRRLTPIAWTFLNYPTIEMFMRDRIDLVHAAALGYPIATRKPYIVTVHDLGPLTHPQFFTNTKPWIIPTLKRNIATRIIRLTRMVTANATMCSKRWYQESSTSSVINVAQRSRRIIDNFIVSTLIRF